MRFIIQTSHSRGPYTLDLAPDAEILRYHKGKKPTKTVCQSTKDYIDRIHALTEDNAATIIVDTGSVSTAAVEA